MSTLGCSVVGIELSTSAAEQAKERYEKVVVGDISKESLWQEIDGPFDRIVMADVLEHLPYPEQVLKKSLDWLSSDGKLIVSMPNIAHWTCRWNLLRGRWNYESRGIMDDTHLRFFTRSTLCKLIEECGYRVDEMDYMFHRPAPGDRYAAKLRLLPVKHRTLDAAIVRMFPKSYAYQFVACCSRA
jgi:cyclopropane fatty-acyl-phospholipid synthase-like methyltransferase